MSQTHRQSIVESVANTAIGFVVSFLSQMVVFPLFDITASFGDHFGITCCFTAISILRNYIVRRSFNQKQKENN